MGCLCCFEHTSKSPSRKHCLENNRNISTKLEKIIYFEQQLWKTVQTTLLANTFAMHCDWKHRNPLLPTYSKDQKTQKPTLLKHPRSHHIFCNKKVPWSSFAIHCILVQCPQKLRKILLTASQILWVGTLLLVSLNWQLHSAPHRSYQSVCNCISYRKCKCRLGILLSD